MNLNCLSNKTNFLRTYSSQHSADIFGICETWLTSTISTLVVIIDGFLFYRYDSPSGIAKHGVGLYVNNAINMGKNIY